MKKFVTKLKHLTLQFLISIDQLAQVIIGGVIYLMGMGPLPSADETISSVVGRRSIDGKMWAKVAEKIINFIFALLGDHDHCRRSVEILSTKKYQD